MSRTIRPGMDRNVKILRVIARLNMGGPAKHVAWLSNGLVSLNYDTTLVCGMVPVGEVDVTDFATKLGVTIESIPQMSRELSWQDLIAIWKVFRLLRREKPEIVHTHTAKAGTVGRIAAALYRIVGFVTLGSKPCRVVHTYHGHVFHSYYGKLKTFAFVSIERALARVTDVIVTISDQQRTEINQHFRVGNPKQFRVVPLGLDLEPFQTNVSQQRDRFRREFGITDETLLVGIVGRLTEVKNHDLFLRAVLECRSDSRSKHCHFMVIGDGHCMESLQQRARQLGIADLVTFTGNRSDPAEFYAGLDIVTLSSRNEGTPLTLIEAFASQRPVVSTLVGGVVDVLGDVQQTTPCGVTVRDRGLSVKSGDATALAAGMLMLANDIELRANLGSAGLDFVFANYSLERLVADMDDLYTYLLTTIDPVGSLRSVAANR